MRQSPSELYFTDSCKLFVCFTRDLDLRGNHVRGSSAGERNSAQQANYILPSESVSNLFMKWFLTNILMNSTQESCDVYLRFSNVLSFSFLLFLFFFFPPGAIFHTPVKLRLLNHPALDYLLENFCLSSPTPSLCNKDLYLLYSLPAYQLLCLVYIINQ